MNYGTAIKSARLDRNQNQIEFANGLGITQTYLSLIENSKRIPSVEVLEKICGYVKIPMVILFWFSVTEKDIPEHKKEAFKMLKPTVDTMIKEIFN